VAAAALGDLVYVAALEAQIHVAPWTIGNFRDALAAGYSARVGERDFRIVAYGVLMPCAPVRRRCSNCRSWPDARRQGLGRSLLRQFVEDAAGISTPGKSFSKSHIEHPGDQALRVGRLRTRWRGRTAYYPSASPKGPREDAIVMRRALAAGPDRANAGADGKS
jgi:tRNA threonylcarbamoyladenosine biosynthesis protein TsaB